MKFVFKWALRLFILAAMLLIVAVLALDPVLRVVIQHRIRAQTGMEAEIGKFSLGLVSPTITIKDLKLYNSPAFGGTPFLDIPEIHVEYDRLALAKSDLHITLLRLDLNEVDIVKNQAGQTNIFSLAAVPSAKKNHRGRSFTGETGLAFTGIDVLNVSVGKARFIDLQDQRNNRAQDFAIQNYVVKNVRSEKDLAILGGFIAWQGGDFFAPFVDQKSSGAGILKLFAH